MPEQWQIALIILGIAVVGAALIALVLFAAVFPLVNYLFRTHLPTFSHSSKNRHPGRARRKREAVKAAAHGYSRANKDVGAEGNPPEPAGSAPSFNPHSVGADGNPPEFGATHSAKDVGAVDIPPESAGRGRTLYWEDNREPSASFQLPWLTSELPEPKDDAQAAASGADENASRHALNGDEDTPAQAFVWDGEKARRAPDANADANLRPVTPKKRQKQAAGRVKTPKKSFARRKIATSAAVDRTHGLDVHKDVPTVRIDTLYVGGAGENEPDTADRIGRLDD
ncbi:MAG: hypothetical protein FWD58_01615 [Firmicutes bacterium]|nr:hypothetical protein [Bacillota bacterium]